MDWAEHPILNKIILAIPFFIAINVIAIDIFLVTHVIHDNKQEKVLGSLRAAADKKIQESFQSDSVNAQRADTTPLTPSSVPTKIPAQINNSSTQNSSVKEYYVPIGTGSFNSVDVWGDVPGVQVNVDSNSYGSIKNVSFEASVHAPNGNQDVSVRLYDKTDDHPVWSSELFFPSGTTENVLGAPINLDSGLKLYKVQMRTQFGTSVSLDQSRIHITTK